MDEPVAHAGGLGVWPIGLSAIEDVRRQLIGATFKLAEPSSLPPITAAELGEKSRAPASSSTSGASGSRALARLLDVARPTYAEEADDPPPKRRHRVSTYRTSCVLWAAARTIRSACASSHSRRSDARSFALPARAGGAGGPGFSSHRVRVTIIVALRCDFENTRHAQEAHPHSSHSVRGLSRSAWAREHLWATTPLA